MNAAIAGQAVPREAVWRAWTAAVIAGEIVGLGGAGLLAILASAVVPEQVSRPLAALLFTLMLAAGAGEGAIVGFAQSLVLRRALPTVPRARWIASTAAGAVLAWATGASVFMSLPEDAAAESLAKLLPLAWVLGALLGGCQWLVLRRHVRGAGWWIVANAAGWGLGLLVSFAVPLAITEDTPTLLAVLLVLATAALTGVSPGLVTGYAMARYADQRDAISR